MSKRSLVLVVWGAPLFQGNWSLQGGATDWFQFCFYKEPIGTRSVAPPPGTAHKAREHDRGATEGPQLRIGFSPFSQKHTGCWSAREATGATRGATGPQTVEIHVELPTHPKYHFLLHLARDAENTLASCSGEQAQFPREWPEDPEKRPKVPKAWNFPQELHN